MIFRRRRWTSLATAFLLSSALATMSSATQEAPREPRAVFSNKKLSFSPATIVSAHFLGAEPLETSIRHPQKPTKSMLFVDWPLGNQTQTGQVNRSVDSGKSFRLLYDPTCAPRSRPTCQTGGGGDTVTSVNPITGTLFFADQEATANEALASSLDYGDTWPAERQFAVVNTGTATTVDRQWLATIDPNIAGIGPRRVEGFLSYRGVTAGAQYIQGIDTSGLPLPQPNPQLLAVIERSGPLLVDNSRGPGRGWLYQPYVGADLNTMDCPCGYRVATAPAESYQDPTAWASARVSNNRPTIFPWLALDTRGNAYAVWVNRGVVYLSASPIDDRRNDPRGDGRPGTYWTEPVRVSLPKIGSAIFGEVTAGAPGRIAITYDGTTDHKGQSAAAPAATRWHTYAAVITNALDKDSTPVVRTGRVSHRVVHRGRIHCGGGCPHAPPPALPNEEPRQDPSLLDFIDIGHDADGRILVAFTDNNSTFAMPQGVKSHNKLYPFTHLARQAGGRGLLGKKDLPDLKLPFNSTADTKRDATWPNTLEGPNLPALDLVAGSVALKGGDLVARMSLVDGTVEAMQRDLAAYNEVPQTTPPATRLQYVVRIMTGRDIYHLSMETLEDGTTNFFGGLLDENDRLLNPAGVPIGAAYHRDENVTVRGTLSDSIIELRVAASQFGLGKGSRLYNVTAFAMAGPNEEDEEFVNPMRTVDATPPVDALLLTGCDLVGTESADRLTGTTGDDVICGRRGVDNIRGRKGADLLRGGLDADTLRGNAGNDTSVGGPGSDSLKDAWGRDYLFGRSGDDTLAGGKKPDSLYGGRGDDLLFGGWAADLLFGGPGRDQLDGDRGADELDGGGGRDDCRSSARTTSCESSSSSG